MDPINISFSSNTLTPPGSTKAAEKGNAKTRPVSIPDYPRSIVTKQDSEIYSVAFKMGIPPIWNNLYPDRSFSSSWSYPDTLRSQQHRISYEGESSGKRTLEIASQFPDLVQLTSSTKNKNRTITIRTADDPKQEFFRNGRKASFDLKETDKITYGVLDRRLQVYINGENALDLARRVGEFFKPDYSDYN